jgi:hypothetical protein
LDFLLRNFRHIIWICGPAWMMKIFKKNQLSSPVNVYSNLCYWSCLSIWRIYWEILTRVRFWSASSECGT